MFLNIHALPGAKKTGLRGLHGDAFKVAVKEAAQDGKANAAIETLIAQVLDLPKGDVELVSGHKSRRKRLFIRGNSFDILQRVEKWAGEAKLICRSD